MPDGRSRVETLSTVPLFAGLTTTALAEVAQGLVQRRFRRGEVIFHLGDPGNAMFIVEFGVVKIVLPSESGEEAILATMQAGEFFGELSLLDGSARSATAVAMGAVRILVLGREQFRKLLGEASIRDALLVGIATELRRLTTRLEELHFLDIAGRLAARLADLAGQAGTLLGDGSFRLDLPLTQSDLAAMVGCTRQSVNKLLGEFEDAGMVRVDRDALVVTDLPRLVTFAHRH